MESLKIPLWFKGNQPWKLEVQNSPCWTIPAVVATVLVGPESSIRGLGVKSIPKVIYKFLESKATSFA